MGNSVGVVVDGFSMSMNLNANQSIDSSPGWRREASPHTVHILIYGRIEAKGAER